MHSFSHAQECTTDGAINVPGLYYSVVRLNETTRQNSCFEVCVRDGNWTGICPKSLFVGMNRLANSSCAMRNYTTQVDSYDKNGLCPLVPMLWRVYKKPGLCDCDCGCCKRSGGNDSRHCCGGSQCDCC